MLKNKLKIIALFIVIILSITIPVVRAENEVTTEETTADETAVINEDGEATNEATSTEETSNNSFKNGDVYLTGKEVTIDYVIDGNLFVFADTVNINSQVGGDVFAFAGTVNIGENGYVFSNLFAFAKDVTVSGIAYDLYAAAETVTINGYIYRDIHTGSDNLNINGVVGRNAFVASNNIKFATPTEGDNTLTSQGIINGDFNYTASSEISIPDGSVAGSANFVQSDSDSISVQDYILDLGKFVVTVVVIWLLALWLAPKFLNNSADLMQKKLLPVVGLGILTPIVVIALFVICILLGITSNIAILTLILQTVLLIISLSVFVIAINQVICNKLKIEKRPTQFGTLIITAICFWLISLIPYVGTILEVIFSIIGMGIVVYSIIPKRKEKKVESTDKKDTKKA